MIIQSRNESTNTNSSQSSERAAAEAARIAAIEAAKATLRAEIEDLEKENDELMNLKSAVETLQEEVLSCSSRIKEIYNSALKGFYELEIQKKLEVISNNADNLLSSTTQLPGYINLINEQYNENNNSIIEKKAKLNALG